LDFPPNYPNIFEVSPHPLPLLVGERGRVRGDKMLEENSKT
jgi:hypothetical protein